MLKAVTLDQIIGKDRAIQWAGTEVPAELKERIISIVLAPPSSKVWDWVRDAKVRAHWDEVTVRAWHLYFAGVSAWEPDAEVLRSDGIGMPWALNVEKVHAIARGLSGRNEEALINAGGGYSPWRYRGETELVSFLTRNGEPDWLSLVGANFGDGGSLVKEFAKVSATFVGRTDSLDDRFRYVLPGLQGFDEQSHLDFSGLARLVRDVGVAGSGAAVSQVITEFLK